MVYKARALPLVSKPLDNSVTIRLIDSFVTQKWLVANIPLSLSVDQKNYHEYTRK